MTEKKKTASAVDILHRRYVGDDPKRMAAIEAARVHAEVARTIYELRTEAGLTQGELAELIGTTQSVISRLEDEDYDGHSLTMLNRIAVALNQKLTVVMKAEEPESGTLRLAFQTVLRNLRRSRGLSLEDLSSKTDIDQEELFAAEHHAGYRPTPLTLHKLSSFFDVPERGLASLAGAFQGVVDNIMEPACRFAAQSESFSKLSKEEKRALDEFIQVLKSGVGTA